MKYKKAIFAMVVCAGFAFIVVFVLAVRDSRGMFWYFCTLELPRVIAPHFPLDMASPLAKVKEENLHVFKMVEPYDIYVCELPNQKFVIACRRKNQVSFWQSIWRPPFFVSAEYSKGYWLD